MIFKKKSVNLTKPLHINSQDLELMDSIKFLGIILDFGLKKYIVYFIKKSFEIVIILPLTDLIT